MDRQAWQGIISLLMGVTYGQIVCLAVTVLQLDDASDGCCTGAGTSCLEVRALGCYRLAAWAMLFSTIGVFVGITVLLSDRSAPLVEGPGTEGLPRPPTDHCDPPVECLEEEGWARPLSGRSDPPVERPEEDGLARPPTGHSDPPVGWARGCGFRGCVLALECVVFLAVLSAATLLSWKAWQLDHSSVSGWRDPGDPGVCDDRAVCLGSAVRDLYRLLCVQVWAFTCLCAPVGCVLADQGAVPPPQSGLKPTSSDMSLARARGHGRMTTWM